MKASPDVFSSLMVFPACLQEPLPVVAERWRPPRTRSEPVSPVGVALRACGAPEEGIPRSVRYDWSSVRGHSDDQSERVS